MAYSSLPSGSDPNPVLVAFREREDPRNIYAVNQWIGFMRQWDNSIVEATPKQVRHAYLVMRLLLGLLIARDSAIVVEWQHPVYRPRRDKRPKSHLLRVGETRSVCGRGHGGIITDSRWAPQCLICAPIFSAMKEPVGTTEPWWFSKDDETLPLDWDGNNVTFGVDEIVSALYGSVVVGFTVVQVRGTDEDGVQHIDIVRQSSLSAHTAKVVYQVTRTAQSVSFGIVGDTVSAPEWD